MSVRQSLAARRTTLFAATLLSALSASAQKALPVTANLETYGGRCFLLCVVNETATDVDFEVLPGTCY